MIASMSVVAFAADDVSPIPKGEIAELNDSSNAEIIPLSGNEVWDKTEAYVGSFAMDGNNLTPVKTIGRDANQLIVYSTNQRVVNNPNCLLEIQIVEAYTLRVLASSGLQRCAPNHTVSVQAHVNKGDQIQVYFRLYDVQGNYRDDYHASLGYSYKYI